MLFRSRGDNIVQRTGYSLAGGGLNNYYTFAGEQIGVTIRCYLNNYDAVFAVQNVQIVGHIRPKSVEKYKDYSTPYNHKRY